MSTLPNSGFLTKKRQLKKIENGSGIQAILDSAYKIMGNPILLHDMEYKVITYTENTVKDDPIWSEYEITGTVGSEWLDFFKNESFFEMAANAKKITFLLSKKLKYDRIFGKLFTKGSVQIGAACMVACYKPFEEGDPVLFEIVCDILNREFANDEFYQSYGQAYMETLVSELIEGDIADKELISAHIESLYIGLKSHIRLALADVSRSGLGDGAADYFRDLFKSKKPGYKYAKYQNRVLIIISSAGTDSCAKKSLSELAGIFEQNKIIVGVSECFENLFELQKYYHQALSALERGLESGEKGRFFYLSGN